MTSVMISRSGCVSAYGSGLHGFHSQRSIAIAGAEPIGVVRRLLARRASGALGPSSASTTSAGRWSSGSRKARKPPTGPPLLPPLPGQRGPPAAQGHRLQPWQPATSARPARRHSELVPHQSSAVAVQDRRTPHSACPALHPAARRKLLDTPYVSADRRAHRAARLASDVMMLPNGAPGGGSSPAAVSPRSAVAIGNVCRICGGWRRWPGGSRRCDVLRTG